MIPVTDVFPRLAEEFDPEGMAILALEWDEAAWHEAGHAVISAVTGVPLHDVTLTVEKRRRAARVYGLTRMTGRRRAWVAVSMSPALAVMSLAGPEAEARRMAATRNMSLRDARSLADSGSVHADLHQAAADLRRASLTVQQARERAADLVADWWPAIGAVAARVSGGEVVAGAEVRRLAGIR